MFTKTIDTLTIVVMLIVLTVLVLEITPIYRTAFNIFSANVYGF